MTDKMNPGEYSQISISRSEPDSSIEYDCHSANVVCEMLLRFRTFGLVHCFILSRLRGMWIMGGIELYEREN